MSRTVAWCRNVGLLAALGGNACADSADGERPTEMSANASLGSQMAANAGSEMAPTMVAQSPSAPEPPPATVAAPSFPGESCDGCARFFLPISGENQRGDFERLLAAPLDLTGATIRFRLMASGFTGNAGGVSVYVRDTGNFDKGFVWTNLTSLATWTDVAVDFTTMLPGNMAFDITKVAKIGVQLNSAGTFAGASWQNATVYLDSVRFSNAPAADLTFADGIGDFALVSTAAPAGASVGFLSP
jgi:hypothetical protein